MREDNANKDRVLLLMSQIEQIHDVKVFYACEAGSRAWGLESADSDYDIRFLFYHPLDWYLTIKEKQRDVIEKSVEPNLDLVGWDIRKACQLARKGNPTLREWIWSPYIYGEHYSVLQKLRQIVRAQDDTAPMFYHYFHMARGQYERYLKGKPIVSVKKYLYTLRPLLIAKYVLRIADDPSLHTPPMFFNALVADLIPSGYLQKALFDLAAKKRAGAELGEMQRDPTLDAFIEQHIDTLDNMRPKKVSGDTNVYDELFRAVVKGELP